MANALTNAFLDDQRSNISSGRHVCCRWLRQELRQLDREIRDEDTKIEAFRSEKGLTRGTYAPITSERLTAISQQLSGSTKTPATMPPRVCRRLRPTWRPRRALPLRCSPRGRRRPRAANDDRTWESGQYLSSRSDRTIQAFVPCSSKPAAFGQRLSRQIESIATSAKAACTAASSRFAAQANGCGESRSRVGHRGRKRQSRTWRATPITSVRTVLRALQ